MLRRISRIGLAVLLGLTAAACGDDDATETGGGGTSDGEGPEAGDAPQGEPIRIGYAVAITGFSSEQNLGSEGVARAWEAWVNDNGGIGGRPVEVVIRDSKADAATMQAVVTELVEEHRVVAALVSDTAAEGAGGLELVRRGIPVIGPAGYSTELWSAVPGVFTMATTVPELVGGHAVAASANGATAFGAMSCAESPACAQAAQIYEPVAQGLGLEWKGLVQIAAAAPNYTSECLILINDGADWINISTSMGVGVRVIDDCLRQGYDGMFGASVGVVVESIFETVPEARFGGILNGFPWWVDAPPVQEYREVMAEYAPDVDYADPTSSSVWAALELFRKTMADATEFTPESVMAAYNQIEGETLEGLLPQPLTFTVGEPAPKVECFWVYRYNSEAGFTAVPSNEPGNGVSGELSTTCFPMGA